MTDQTEQDTTKKLLSTTDAAVWTDEFMRLFGHRLADIDWGLMVGWFANAIETGRQKSKWKPAPPPDERRVQEPQPEETPAT